MKRRDTQIVPNLMDVAPDTSASPGARMTTAANVRSLSDEPGNLRSRSSVSSASGASQSVHRGLGDSRRTLRDEFLELQWSQLRHDELYHKDVVLLPVGQRLKHMTLHFAKYVGSVSEALESNDAESMTRALVDSFVITLVCSNILNLDLGDELGRSTPASNLRELGAAVLGTIGRPSEDKHWFLRRFAQHTSRMAKACESLDHLEAFDYRGTLRQQVVMIAKLILAESAARDLNVVDLSRTRLREVERGSIFDRQLARLRGDGR